MTQFASQSAIPDPIAVDFQGFSVPVYDPAHMAKGYGDGSVFFAVSEGRVYLMLSAEDGSTLIAGLEEDQLHGMCSQIAQQLIQDDGLPYSTPPQVLQ